MYISPFPVMHCGRKSLKKARQEVDLFVKISHHEVILCHLYSVISNGDIGNAFWKNARRSSKSITTARKSILKLLKLESLGKYNSGKFAKFVCITSLRHLNRKSCLVQLIVAVSYLYKKRL